MTRTDLLRAGPYRLMFPLGMLGGLLGVGHWILWSAGWLADSNPFFHSTMMVQGFLACFVVGFLMTALPRFLATDTARLWEVALVVTAALFFAGASLSQSWVFAQIAFLTLIVSALLFGARRLPRRTKNPPDSFLLVAFGLLHAVLASLLLLASGMGRNVALMETARQMLQIGFLLCLVLGIAGYLAPFLMGYGDDPSCDPDVHAKGMARWKLFVHAAAGALILASFFVEGNAPRVAAGLRAVITLGHLLVFAKIARPIRRKRTHVVFFWTACWMVAAGVVSAFLWPEYRIGALHILFIGGYSLMIFAFALNVILSHGAQPELLQGRLNPLWIMGTAVMVAMALRVTADLDAWRYQMWIQAASGTWFLAGVFWLGYIFPKLWSAPHDTL